MKSKVKRVHCGVCGVRLHSHQERHWIEGTVVCRHCAIRTDPRWVSVCDDLMYNPKAGAQA